MILISKTAKIFHKERRNDIFSAPINNKKYINFCDKVLNLDVSVIMIKVITQSLHIHTYVYNTFYD